MTTMTIQEELARLGTVTAADIKKEALANNVFRPDTRPAVVAGHARVQILGRRNVTTKSKDGTTEYTTEKLMIRFSNLSNVKVWRSAQPFTESSFEYGITYYDEPHPNSELGRTIAALGEQNTILAIADVDCDFEEVIVPAETDKDGNIKQTKGRDGRMYNSQPNFYYRFYNLNGATASTAASTATLEGEEIACVVASGKTDAELTPNNFLTAYSAAGGNDPVVQAEIAGRKFLARMVSESKLTKLEDGTYSLMG